MKGIILAGGSGSRLSPITNAISKQLLPVYDKPMIYYPLSVLMLAGIREVLIISSKRDLPLFQNLLGSGEQWGISLNYLCQDEPRGLPDAFIIGKKFIDQKNVCLILGDNLFYGESLHSFLRNVASKHAQGAKVFGYHVNDPERYGVVKFDQERKVLDLVEKPSIPPSNYAVTGLYFYDHTVVERSLALNPSKRGELEITDLNRSYLKDRTLELEVLGRGVAWLDTGTSDSLLEAGNFIAAIEKRQGLKIACLEEIALRSDYISFDDFSEQAKSYAGSAYGDYLENFLRIMINHY